MSVFCSIRSKIRPRFFPLSFLGEIASIDKGNRTLVKGFIMTQRAPLIDELEKILNDGGSDQELCDKAIEIVEWLVEESEIVKHTANISKAIGIKAQEDFFVLVIDQIHARRHDHALDAFKKHCIDQGYLT